MSDQVLNAGLLPRPHNPWLTKRIKYWSLALILGEWIVNSLTIAFYIMANQTSFENDHPDRNSNALVYFQIVWVSLLVFQFSCRLFRPVIVLFQCLIPWKSRLLLFLDIFSSNLKYHMLRCGWYFGPVHYFSSIDKLIAWLTPVGVISGFIVYFTAVKPDGSADNILLVLALSMLIGNIFLMIEQKMNARLAEYLQANHMILPQQPE